VFPLFKISKAKGRRCVTLRPNYNPRAQKEQVNNFVKKKKKSNDCKKSFDLSLSIRDPYDHESEVPKRNPI
jgi:hypothetical protein